MHINLRRTIAVFFVLFFLIGFLPLIFITSGRLYNLKKGEFEKTTLLILESEPKNAQILLNGRAPENWWALYLPFLENKTYTTPARLHYLLPDTYKLSVSKEGYIPWAINVNLEGDTSTIIDTIKLWPVKLSDPLLPEPAKTVAISPKGTYIVYANNDNIIKLLTVNNSTLETIPFTEKSISKLWWRPDERALLAKGEDTFQHYSFEDKVIKNISLTSVIEDILWSDSSPATLYGIESDTIEVYSLITNTSTKINTPQRVDVNLYKDRLTLLTPGALEIYLNDETLKIFKSPNGEKLTKIVDQDTVWIYISTEQGKLLRFHKPSSQWQVLNVKNVNDIAITSIGNQAVWWNEFEIGSLSLEKNTSKIQTRLSEEILEVIVDNDYENDHHLILTNERVLALDNLPGGASQTTSLFSLSAIQSSFYNDKSKELFIIASNKENLLNIWVYATTLE